MLSASRSCARRRAPVCRRFCATLRPATRSTADSPEHVRDGSGLRCLEQQRLIGHPIARCASSSQYRRASLRLPARHGARQLRRILAGLFVLVETVKNNVPHGPAPSGNLPHGRAAPSALQVLSVALCDGRLARLSDRPRAPPVEYPANAAGAISSTDTADTPRLTHLTHIYECLGPDLIATASPVPVRASFNVSDPCPYYLRIQCITCAARRRHRP